MRRLNEYEPFLKALSQTICEKAELSSDPPLAEILRNPKLIVTLNHATALSWIPAISLLTTQVVEAGGCERLSLGVMDKFLHANPLTRPLAEYITQSREGRSFDELLADVQKRDQVDLVIFPEGARTFFGSLDEIQEFRSSRFLELSIRAQAPLLLAVHRGSEHWNLGVPIPREWGSFLLPFSSFFGEGLLKSGLLNLPFRLQKIPRFAMRLHLYSPTLYESDLAENPAERKAQLQEEGDKVRALMQEIWDGLPASG